MQKKGGKKVKEVEKVKERGKKEIFIIRSRMTCGMLWHVGPVMSLSTVCLFTRLKLTTMSPILDMPYIIYRDATSASCHFVAIAPIHVYATKTRHLPSDAIRKIEIHLRDQALWISLCSL